MKEQRSANGDTRFLTETMQQMRLAPQAGVVQFIIGDGASLPGERRSAFTVARHYAAEPWHKLTAALLLLEDLVPWLDDEAALADPELAGVREQVIAALAAFGLVPGDIGRELSTSDPDTCRDRPAAHGVRPMKGKRKAAE